MSHEARVEVVTRLAARLHEFHGRRDVTRFQAIQRTVAAARVLFSERAATAVEALRFELAAHDGHGAPPPLLRLAGRTTDEKPFNRFLGWLLEPDRDHGAALVTLRSLAVFLGFDALTRELAVAAPSVAVRCEQTWPEAAGSSREPDLLVLVPGNAPRAILLLENKVESGEGREQYSSYLAALERLCAHHGLQATERRAYLLAPEERETPVGWNGAITHTSLSRFLVEVANESSMPEWDRILCFLVGDAFAHDAAAAAKLQDTRVLLERLSSTRPRPRDLRRIAALLPLPKPFRWRLPG